MAQRVSTRSRKSSKSDLDGMPDAPNGFVFVTNQTLSPTQRSTLSDMVKAKGKESDIVHLQQLQNLLDSGHGYEVRIQYLGIGMNVEEQISWHVVCDSQTPKALAAHTRELLALRSAVDRMRHGQSHIIQTLALTTATSAATPDLISVSSFVESGSFPAVSAHLSP